MKLYLCGLARTYDLIIIVASYIIQLSGQGYKDDFKKRYNYKSSNSFQKIKIHH